MLICIFTIPIINVNAVAYWYSLDEKNDVIYYSNGEYQDTGNYYDAIDIVSVSIDNDSLIMSFDKTPAYFENYYYSFDIIWDYDISGEFNFHCSNYSSATFGGIGDWNSISTTIILENGTFIYDSTTYLEIFIDKKSIIFPIPGLDYILDKVPENLYATASYRSNFEPTIYDYYIDIANGTIVSGHLPGFSAMIGIASFFSIILLFSYRKKK